jgi:putative ABC transport system substrate-binding protein
MLLLQLALTMILSLLGPPVAAEAQQAMKVARVGVLTGATLPESPPWVAFREELRKLSYVEGQSIVIEWRISGGVAERFPGLAAELVRLPVDVIVASDNPAAAAARRASTTVPIVVVLATDPVGTGFAASLARPGGNITGLTMQSTELQGKSLQLLTEAVPKVSRVAVIWDPTEPGRLAQANEAERIARAVGLRPRLLELRSPAALDRTFAALAGERTDATLLQASQMIYANRVRIAELALRNRLPIMGWRREWVEAGALLAYGGSFVDQFRRAAHFVDRILKGARPSELPIEQPVKFELFLNAKTAKALGLTIPPSLLVRADYVIE